MFLKELLIYAYIFHYPFKISTVQVLFIQFRTLSCHSTWLFPRNFFLFSSHPIQYTSLIQYFPLVIRSLYTCVIRWYPQVIWRLMLISDLRTRKVQGICWQGGGGSLEDSHFVRRPPPVSLIIERLGRYGCDLISKLCWLNWLLINLQMLEGRSQSEMKREHPCDRCCHRYTL